MARPLRTDFAGAVHHVTSRGNERRDIFTDDVDRQMFLQSLGEAVQRFGWSVTAFVLMTNHFHLVIHTPEANLSRGMQWLNTKYVVRYNRRHRRCGHLYQGRFNAILIDKESYFTEVLRYVVLNPVRAGMVERPDDYRWSSYRATAGLERGPEWLDVRSALDAFAPDAAVAVANYRDFVEAKVGSTDCLWDKLTHGIYLGSEAWAKKIRAIVESKLRSTDHPVKHRAIGRPRMAAVMTTVARTANTSASAIRAMRGGKLRRVVAWIGWNEGWATLRSIAASLRIGSQGHVSGMIRRAERELAHDAWMLALVDRSVAALRA